MTCLINVEHKMHVQINPDKSHRLTVDPCFTVNNREIILKREFYNLCPFSNNNNHHRITQIVKLTFTQYEAMYKQITWPYRLLFIYLL